MTSHTDFGSKTQLECPFGMLRRYFTLEEPLVPDPRP